ncbi:MAG: MBL fold metallo-hydrolase [Oscillospiraceae bacterium]|nr:MBL fold metallo-hydrolase [Oscillospiraceae bacterium]
MKFKIYIILILAVLSLLLFACQAKVETPGNNNNDVSGNLDSQIKDEQEKQDDNDDNDETSEKEAVTKMLYQGHASFRITASDGTVIYLDPYAGDGYDVPADIILVTHQHNDHNNIKLVTQKEGCKITSNKEALEGGTHNTFSVKNIEIEAVKAENNNHNPKDCVGYIITVDGIKIYFAGDTSKTDQMDKFSEKEIDYALLPCDGVYNMNAEEAAECAKIIGAKHNIPMHTKVGELFDREIAENFDAPDRLIAEAGEEIILSK